MNKGKKIIALSIVIIFIIIGIPIFRYFSEILQISPPLYPPTEPIGWEVDAKGTTYHIVDGDTYDMTEIERVKLADINSPELGQNGSIEAKNYLISLIYNETIYLDIDDVYITDPYNNTIGVCYVRINITHCLNVNKALLFYGYALLFDYMSNEFNPSDWVLYNYYVE